MSAQRHRWVDKNGNPITEDEAMSAWRDEHNESRYIGRDEVNGHLVSTVWLVLNHGWGDEAIPNETMIFAKHPDCPLDEYQDRYANEAEALAGHARAVAAAASCPRATGGAPSGGAAGDADAA